MKPRRNRAAVILGVLFGAIVLLSAIALVADWTEDSGAPAPASAPASASAPAPASASAPVSTPYAHLERFQAIADEYGDRAAGTSGYEAAAEYVEQQLSSSGYETTRQYFTFEHRDEEIASFNIIAETEGGGDKNTIVLGAHLDGVPGSAAINDNASGSAALLIAAKEVAQLEEIENKVRFIWWGAEEFPRAHGSSHYVENLAENDGDELDNIAAYLNFDMVASPNYVVAVYDAREPKDHRRREVPDGSLDIMIFLTDYFESRDQPWVPVTWDFVSDQVAFVEEGIAVGGLFTGGSERKTNRQANIFGGTAGEPRDPNYHTQGDDINNVSREALSIVTDAITHAAVTLAEDGSALE